MPDSRGTWGTWGIWDSGDGAPDLPCRSGSSSSSEVATFTGTELRMGSLRDMVALVVVVQLLVQL